jgi:predicted DNA-binding transcriptional regulator YafY
MIREGARTGRAPNSGHFTRELGVSRRTVMRDLDFLRDDEKAPVAYNAKLGGYELTEATYALPPVNLSRREVFGFSIARKLLQAFEGTPLELDMGSVLGKIAESLEGTTSLSLDALTDELSVVSEDYTRVKRGVWETMARHVNGRERLRVTYQRFDGAVGSYLLEPYHLVAYHGNWYVLAGKVPGGRVATFALSRCRQVGGTGEHFWRPPGFDPRAYLRQAFGISRADQPWKVRLRFSPQVATYVRERVWHPSQALREGRDGSLEMRMEASSRKGVVRWILSWAPEVQVLAPRELQERIRRKLRDGLRRCSRVRPR